MKSLNIIDNYIITQEKVFESTLAQNCLADFVKKPFEYKQQYLQKNYGYGFDGYSFQGQKDSTNQAYDDMVDSFVISDIFPVSKYPQELHPIRGNNWVQLMRTIKSIEHKIITSLAPNLSDFYENNICHMLSANYYPPIKEFASTADHGMRLSAHTDVSLFTVFPFGVDEGLEYYSEKESCWKSLGKTDTIFAFPGFLAQLLTGGELKALQHRVKLPKDKRTERFSFAYFSIPLPEKTFEIIENKQSVLTSSEVYFKKYLALF